VIENQNFGVQDFVHEIRLISSCSHDNIVRFLGYYSDDHHAMCSVNLVMEYMKGGPLDEFLKNDSNVRHWKCSEREEDIQAFVALCHFRK